MLINYFKLTFRLLVRSPFFAFINLTGLSTGIASFFILWQYSSTELKSDQFYQDFERIVRVGTYWNYTDDGKKWGKVTFGAILSFQASQIARDFPEVKSFTQVLQQPQFSKRTVGYNSNVVVSFSRNNDREVFEGTRIAYAESNFFEFFNLPLIQGTKEKVLDDAGSVVISRSTAVTNFGNINPVGQILTMNDSIHLTVTGVFADFPQNTHLRFDMIASGSGLTMFNSVDNGAITNVYLKLNRGTSMDDLQYKINKKVADYWSIYLSKDALRIEMFLQPLKDIVFSDPYEYDFLKLKSRSTLQLLRFVSVIIVLMAWINHMNFSASRMLKRTREIAARKISGAESLDFAQQFLMESFVINGLAVALAFTFMQLARLPATQYLDIYIPQFSDIRAETWIVFVFVITVSILLSGFYPIIMSVSFGFRSLIIFSKKGRKRNLMTRILTITQYTSAIVLISWSFIVFFQLDFILNKDIGINREEIIVLEAPVIRKRSYLSDFAYFKNELSSLSGVREVTYSFAVIGDVKYEISVKRFKNQNIIGMDSNGGVDETFIPFYGIKLIAGRNFIAGEKPNAIIVSRFGTQRLGYENFKDAVGEKIIIRNEDDEQDLPAEIIGVIEDYRFKPLLSMGEATSASITGGGICLVYKNNLITSFYPRKIAIKINVSSEETIAGIKLNYDNIFPGNIFKWYFLDDHINKGYEQERISRNQIMLFTILAIGIAALGLLGMIAILADAKTKEIGIRKVIGANLNQIARELLRGFTVQIMISIMIAVPISYYLANHYLERFIERITLQWWHFTLPIFILLIIMFLTVASVLFKAAKASPVESLRYE